jgi:hypothetical protein
MGNRDVLGEWFDAMVSLGEDMTIRFGRVVEKGAAPVWSGLPHSRFDGVGAFAHLLREHGHPALEALPQLKDGLRPRIFQILRAWARHVFVPKPTYRWPALAAPGTGGAMPAAIAARIFDEEESRHVVASAKSLGVTVNTYLLDRISRVVRRSLAGQPAVIAWMIPVNMRGPVKLADDTSNHSSFLEVTVHEDEPVGALQERVRDAVRSGQHWAYWYSFQFGRIFGRIGRRLFIGLQLHGPKHWVGSFSNLGVWDPPTEDGSAAYAWTFCPPPAPSQPLCVGCVTYRGRLGLALQIHPSLTTSPQVAEAWLSDGADELLAAHRE